MAVVARRGVGAIEGVPSRRTLTDRGVRVRKLAPIPGPVPKGGDTPRPGPPAITGRRGVLDLYAARMLRSGALSGVGLVAPPRRAGVVARPVVRIGRGTMAHELARRPGSRPHYRRLRVGGPLPRHRPRQRRRGGEALTPTRVRLAWRGASPWLVSAMLMTMLLLGAAAIGLA